MRDSSGECVVDTTLNMFAPESCDPGYKKDESGKCVEDLTVAAANEPCDPGYMRDSSGECVVDTTLNMFAPESCDPGYKKDESGKCVEDTTPSPPTTDDCTADPTKAGCPTPDQCSVDPKPANCPKAAAAPTADDCTADPTKAGCPTPDQCSVDPKPANCPKADVGTLAFNTGPSAALAPPGVEECQEGKYQSHCYKTCETSDVVNCNEEHNCSPDSYVASNGDCVPCDKVCQDERAKLTSNPEPSNPEPSNLGKCDEGEYLDEDNGNVCKPCDDHSEQEEECKDKDEDEDKDEEGSIPTEFIKLLLNFDQEINQGFKCNKVKVEDKNIVLCRDAGITQQQIVAQNPLNCPTQTENIPLTGTLEPQGLRLLADLDPCMIQDGSITLNMPNTEDIKLGVMYLDKTGNNHKGALINPGQIQALSNNQGLFKLDLDQIMMGKDPKTGEITTLTKINGLALYNNGESLIHFGPSNSVALTAILAQGALSGPYFPGNNIRDSPITMSDSISQNPSIPPPTTSSSSPSPLSPPINTTTSSSTSLSLANLNTLDQNQLIDAISSKISQLRTFEKNKISQALFDLTQSTAAKGGDVMNSLRQIGTKILQNPSDPLVDRIIGLAQTK
jgi:hypothetical protein